MSVIEIFDEYIFNAPPTFNVLPREKVVPLKGATPSVRDNNNFYCNNASALTVTDFKQGQEGHKIYVKGDGKTTIANNANIHTSSSANKLLLLDVVYIFVRFNSKWYEVANGQSSSGGSGTPDYSYMHDGEYVIYSAAGNQLVSTPDVKVNRVGDTMTGPLIIDNQSANRKLQLGDASFDYAGAGIGNGGVISVAGNFVGNSKDLLTLLGTLSSKHGSLGIYCAPSWLIEEDNDINASAFFGATKIDNTGGYINYVYHALHAGGHPQSLVGTLYTAIGLEIYDMDFATNYWSIKTGLGLVELGDNLHVHGHLGIGNSAAASVAVGSLVKKIQIYDASGVSLGFIPVYASIT